MILSLKVSSDLCVERNIHDDKVPKNVLVCFVAHNLKLVYRTSEIF